jgi:hypothetical protein
VGWVVDAELSGAPYGDGGSSETFCNVSPPSDPLGYGFFFKPFHGTAPSPTINVFLYQDNPTTPGTKFTLSGYAGAELNYSGYFATNSPPPQTLFVIEFLNSSSTIIASNAYDLIAASLPNTGASGMILFTTPQFTAPAGTVTVRAGAYMGNTYATVNPQNFFVDSFDLEAIAASGAPNITNGPPQVTVGLGGTAHFNVQLSNPTGVTYAWQFYQTNISNGGEYSGVTTANLTVTGVTAADVGHYRVFVSNGSGSLFSNDGTLAIVGANFYPVVSITGKIGDTYAVDYSTAIAPTTWIPLTTNILTASPTQVIDTSSPNNNSRFYRARFLQ